MTTLCLFEEDGGGIKLGIQPLAGDLFNRSSIKDLSGCLVNNDLLLQSIHNLTEFEDENRNLVSINYRALDVEELGSVYEGLLELHPVIENIEAANPNQITFLFHEGTERKTTGSYYTRPDLVNELIKSALIPVIKERLKKNAGNKEAQEEALLKLKVCDPAAGSGHMILAAARTIAWELACIRSGESNPAPSVYRTCLREVIQHCVYAVDMNPDAVELCKLSLWLESHNSGKPISFLDHKIRCGNSLVGVTDLSVLKKGIPDDAFSPVTGDDKDICRELKRANASFRRTGQYDLFDSAPADQEIRNFSSDYNDLEKIRQDNLETVKQVRSRYEHFRKDNRWLNDWTACNVWTSAFFYTYNQETKQSVPSTERLQIFMQRPAAGYGPTIGKADSIAVENRFFHWPLEFPDVFSQGGFDVMLGNPPWERIKLQEKEFFSLRDPKIAKEKNASKRKELIKSLKENNPQFFYEYIKALHQSEAESKFIRNSYRFPKSAYGDINTYAIFCELFYSLINKKSRAGLIIPAGIATDNTTKALFSDFVNNQRLVQLIGFENEEMIFPSVHHAFKFCAITLTGDDNKIAQSSFTFFHRNFTSLQDLTRNYKLSKSDFALLNPNTLTCPIFRTVKDYDLTKKIYSKYSIIDFENEPSRNLIKYEFFTLFHMTNDSSLFTKASFDTVPLYEAKMFYHYDHRYATYENATQANLNEGNLPQLDVYSHQNPQKQNVPNFFIKNSDLTPILIRLGYLKKYLLAYRGISNSSSERTLISSILPLYGVGNSAPCINIKEGSVFDYITLLSSLNSICVDYTIKQKFSGNNINFFVIKQIPLPTKNEISPAILNQIIFITIELVFTSWDIKCFADDVWKEADEKLRLLLRTQWDENKTKTGGHKWDPPKWCEIDNDGCPFPPFKWDEDRRAVLKAELDAIYAKLYGLTTDELRYILDPQDVYGPDFPGETFRVLKEKEIRNYGEYRTKRLVMEAWERLNNS